MAMRFLSPAALLGLSLLFVIPGPIQGQFDAESLAELGAVDAQIYLSWDDDLPGSESVMVARLQTIFELELRKASISVSTEAINFLGITLVLLDVTTAGGSSTGVAFSYGIGLRELVSGSRRALPPSAWGYTWVGPSGVSTSAYDGLTSSLERNVTEMAQSFANAYLKANPR